MEKVKKGHLDMVGLEQPCLISLNQEMSSSQLSIAYGDKVLLTWPTDTPGYCPCAPVLAGVRGNGVTATHILPLGSRWRSVASFTPRPLYPKEKSFLDPNQQTNQPTG
jgi:hypothetical protein